MMVSHAHRALSRAPYASVGAVGKRLQFRSHAGLEAHIVAQMATIESRGAASVSSSSSSEEESQAQAAPKAAEFRGGDGAANGSQHTGSLQQFMAAVSPQQSSS